MPNLKKILFLPAICWILLVGSVVIAEIEHLELGAANYRANQSDPHRKFAILKYTLDVLVRKYGRSGKFVLSDQHADGLEQAADFLRDWISKDKRLWIDVETKAGNYHEMIEEGAIGKFRSIYLQNPGTSQVPSTGMDASGRRYVTNRLEDLAKLSSGGLLIVSYMHQSMANLAALVRESTLIPTGKEGHLYHPPTEVDKLKLVVPKKPSVAEYVQAARARERIPETTETRSPNGTERKVLQRPPQIYRLLPNSHPGASALVGMRNCFFDRLKANRNQHSANPTL